MKPSGKPRVLSIGAALLIFAACFGLMLTALFGGFIPGFEYGGVYTHSPTATYQGYLSINYLGIYHHVQAVPNCRSGFLPCATPDEALFFMNAKNGTIRLIFYCGSAVKYYCDIHSQLPFGDGACLHVKGTLIEPSKWPSRQYAPSMHFSGDLYVFENETLPETSCS